MIYRIASISPDKCLGIFDDWDDAMETASSMFPNASPEHEFMNQAIDENGIVYRGKCNILYTDNKAIYVEHLEDFK